MVLVHYGVRLRKDQLEYLKTKEDKAGWIRAAVDNQIRQEKKRV